MATRDEIAREAAAIACGLTAPECESRDGFHQTVDCSEMDGLPEREWCWFCCGSKVFAAALGRYADQVREECAEIAEKYADDAKPISTFHTLAAADVAAAIREEAPDADPR